MRYFLESGGGGGGEGVIANASLYTELRQVSMVTMFQLFSD